MSAFTLAILEISDASLSNGHTFGELDYLGHDRTNSFGFCTDHAIYHSLMKVKEVIALIYDKFITRDGDIDEGVVAIIFLS